MGSSILDLVLGKLREAGFTADVAFPGQDSPVITDTVAVVHLQEVDRAGLTVTVGVHVIAPAARGGTACEMEALRATEVLRWAGASCVQKACRYDPEARAYLVEILAAFTGLTDAESYTPGPGFQVFLGQNALGYVKSFTAELQRDYKAEYAIGEEAPVGYSRSRESWELTLEELYPAGSPEIRETEAPVTLKVLTEGKTEVYYNCYWTSVRRKNTREGLLKIRKALSDRRVEL